MALEMQNFEALSPPVVKKITWWTLLCRPHTVLCRLSVGPGVYICIALCRLHVDPYCSV